MTNHTPFDAFRTDPGPRNRDSRARGPIPAHVDPIGRLVEALRVAGCDPRPTGSGWEAICPAHRGERRNLVVSQGDDGRALAYCHHGCPLESILAVLGLTVADLFPAPPAGRGRGRKAAAGSSPPVAAATPVGSPASQATPAAAPTTKHAATAKHRPYVYPNLRDAARAALESIRRSTGDPSWTDHAGHLYRDLERRDVMAVFRFYNAAGEKETRPFERVERGWRRKSPPPPLPLYRLSQVVASPCVFVVEGEKVADFLKVQMGLTATCSAFGAKSPEKTDWSPLAGKDVWICPDYDRAGHEYEARLVNIFRSLDPIPRVRTIPLSQVWPTYRLAID